MEPKYITLEQSKWFKEKGFDEKVKRFFDLISNTEIGDASLGNYNLTKQSVSIPEQHVVVEWLRVNHDIWVGVIPDVGMDLIYTYKIYSVEVGVERGLANGNNYDTPQEAYSAAFDYIKNNNLI
jgi:hypothetical protein